MEGGLGARCHDSQQSTALGGAARVHYGNAVIDKADTTHSGVIISIIISIISHSHKTDDNFGRKGE